MATNQAGPRRSPQRLLCIIVAALAATFASIAFGAGSDEIIARGKYLAELGGCQSCHTQAGAPAYAGGRFIDTPFGQVSSPNITADPVSGIGQWSAEDFYRAMHEGMAMTRSFSTRRCRSPGTRSSRETMYWRSGFTCFRCRRQ